MKLKTISLSLLLVAMAHVITAVPTAYIGQAMCENPDQVYMKCGTACPPTCSDPNPSCTKQCVAGCQCPYGTVLDESTDRCVAEADCPQRKCSIPGQVYRECGTACPPTCEVPNPDFCILPCVQGCQCVRGLVFDEVNNRCVHESQCPQRKCSIPGQVYRECWTACPPTCQIPNPELCTLQCVQGCQCVRGLVFDEVNNRCVHESQCPPCCAIG